MDRTLFPLLATLGLSAASLNAEPLFDLDEIRDTTNLEVTVLQDWKPAPKDPAIHQKLLEITVCEWWSGQKVRLPVTLNALAEGGPCQNLIVANQPLAKRAILPTGGQLELLKNHGVGVVLIGMGTIDAMEPKGELHLGMGEQLLKTKDVRYTPAWIWGLSQMRALTAAMTEPEVFQPQKVLTTGGSKRGVASAVAGIHDDRFTAILPVVAPMLGNPGAPTFVIGTEPKAAMEADEAFLKWCDKSVQQALLERADRRAANRITLSEAKANGWSDAEIFAITDRAWDSCRITNFLPELEARGLDIFYNVGTNDSVSPALLELGDRFPDFPVCIIPGGQHGGPATVGFTRQVPKLPEIQNNFLSFARHHFFGDRSFLAPPKIESDWDAKTRTLTVRSQFPAGTKPETNTLWWNLERREPHTLPFEYDEWNSLEMKAIGSGHFEAAVTLEKTPARLDFVSVHTHTENELPLTISSPYQRIEPSTGTRITLVEETFSGDSLPEKWEPGGRPNSFSILDGALRGVAQPDDGHGPSIGLPITGHDLTVDFDVKLAKPESYFLFLIDGDSQFQGQAHLLRFAANGEKLQLMQDRGDTASKRAQKKERDAQGGKRIPPTKEQLADPSFYRIERLASQSATPNDGRWHHVRIQLRGNEVTARFDRGPEFSATGTVLDVPKSRIVFLVGNAGDVRIDNVRISDLSPPPSAP